MDQNSVGGASVDGTVTFVGHKLSYARSYGYARPHDVSLHDLSRINNRLSRSKARY